MKALLSRFKLRQDGYSGGYQPQPSYSAPAASSADDGFAGGADTNPFSSVKY